MNKLEERLVKLGLWAFGIMFTAIFTMVTLTYQSQLNTENLIRSFKAEQIPVNQYTIRRLAYDSTNIMILQQQVAVLQYWVKKINPESFKEDPIVIPKINGILPKTEDQTTTDIEIVR